MKKKKKDIKKKKKEIRKKLKMRERERERGIFDGKYQKQKCNC